MAVVKGSPFNKSAYEEAFKCMYDLLRLARRDGMLALEPHISKPEESSIFSKYPKVAAQPSPAALHLRRHGAADRRHGQAGADGRAARSRAEGAWKKSIMRRCRRLTKMADALPGFGIVAAVLGIVITMGHIDGPPAEIGHKVGAALVGTFLGILLSYGFAAPLATRMEFLGMAEGAFFRTIASIVVGFANNLAAEGGDRNGPPRRDKRIPPGARRTRRMVQGSGSSVRKSRV